MRAVPDISELGRMKDQESVRLSIAGVALMRHVALLLEPLKLTPSRSLALDFIDAHPGADQISLGRAMGMNRGSTMVLIDHLESTGFVRRDPGPDRRSNALYLTREGESALESALRVNEEMFSTVFAGVKPSDWAPLRRMIDEVLANTSG